MSAAVDLGRMRDAALEAEAARRDRVAAARDAGARPVCHRCGSESLSLEGEFQNAVGECRVYGCGECGLSQLDRRYSVPEVEALEDENRAYQVDAPDVEAQVAAHSFIVEFVERFVPPAEEGPRGRLLEVGCSRGYKLEAARRAGWAVQGVELSGASATFARDALGLPVHRGTLDSFEPDGCYDAVVAWHVLEHVPSAVGFLSLLHAFTRPGGHIFLQVPSYERYRSLEPWTAHPSCFNPVHFWYFTKQSLEKLVGECGFAPVWTLDDERTLHLTVVAERQ